MGTEWALHTGTGPFFRKPLVNPRWRFARLKPMRQNGRRAHLPVVSRPDSGSANRIESR